jgi:hypothetical protein
LRTGFLRFGTKTKWTIAQAIAQKHQADLNVDSRVGQGSLFTLEMNRAYATENKRKTYDLSLK